MSLFFLLGWFFTLLAFCGAGYALLAAFLVGRFVHRPQATAEGAPAITVLKPLHGAEPALERNLETFFRQDYPGPFQLIFGVQDRGDGAIAVLESLRARHQQIESALVVDGTCQGKNPKVSNLINMTVAAQHDILVLSDSDISVAPDYLRRIAAALAPPDVGAVTCLYTGWAAAGFASRLCAMGISYHFLPNVVTGVGLGLTEPCFGSTIAVKKRVLEEIGGFRAFASQLADDNEIGRAVRATGRRVAIPSFVVRHACGEASLGEWFCHELRWMRTIRTVDPAGHAGSIVTHAFPLALLGAIFAGFGFFSLVVLLATILARGVLKGRIDAAFGGPAGDLWLLPVRDVLSFGVFITSLFGASVVWQDAHLRVHQDGGLSNR